MKNLSLTILLSIACFSFLNAQMPGDTISVQAFNFDSNSRDTMISFPDDPNLTYEKILLKYSMKCEGGLVNPGDNSRGCGEWDFSCNTYLVDSTKIESQQNNIGSHFITNFEGATFPFKETPVFDYLRGTQTDVQITATNSEFESSLGSGLESITQTLSTANLAGKSQYLYTAAELAANGLSAGDIQSLALRVSSSAGEAKFLRIKLKNSQKTELNGLIDFDDFTEVYYNNPTLNTNELNRFNFHTPFIWDGSSNIIVEYNFTNLDASDLTNTILLGESVSQSIGLSSTNESEMLLTNQTYLECDNYFGVTGSQNRTMEAWIKTTKGTNGEIISWGPNTTSNKWVFRFVDGRLRLEIAGGGTESTTLLNDGEWHHVACVLNGSTLSDISFYVDGVEDNTTNVSSLSVNTTQGIPVRVSRGVNTRYLDATIDDVRIWNTNLSEATINEWKSLKVDSNHPNASNLQLDFQFNESGNQVSDSSGNGRGATVIGDDIKVSQVDGSTLFKDFIPQATRPNTIFYQGDYDTNVTDTTVDRPIAQEPQHFVVSRTIASADPTIAVDDEVINSVPTQYWGLTERTFDEATGAFISENTLTADGEIEVTELQYFRRFPFYNELVSFVTPYGIGLDLGDNGKSWFMDMSDYVHILRDNKRLLMTLGGQFQEQMDLEFLFIVGTPPREVIQYDQIWQGTNRIGNATIASILDDSKIAPTTLLAGNAETFKLKSTITGHGSEGEFAQNGGNIDHIISVNKSEIFNWDINQECSFNPIFPQGGTWVFDRQGWCPGEQSFTNEQDLTPFLSPDTPFEIDYTTSSPPTAGGDYRYHMAHQLIGYGPANFQTDASIVGISSPNNSAEYTRTGTICSNPTIMIRNTGANELTQLTINYWINESQSPQTYEWTGSLAFMEDEIVTIPSPPALWFDLLADDNVFHAEVSAPNQGTDEYVNNNSFSSTFDLPQLLPNNISVSIRTNNIPADNNYQLIDSDGNILESNPLPIGNTIFTDDFELPDGCFKLVVNDTGNDGLEFFANPNQGIGYVRLLFENGVILRVFEPDFGGGFEFNFTTSFPVSVKDLEFLTSIEMYPNPANHQCTIEADGLLDTELYIIDILGKQTPLQTTYQSDTQVSFNVNHLTAGIYFVSIRKGELLTTRKLIIE